MEGNFEENSVITHKEKIKSKSRKRKKSVNEDYGEIEVSKKKKKEKVHLSEKQDLVADKDDKCEDHDHISYKKKKKKRKKEKKYKEKLEFQKVIVNADSKLQIEKNVEIIHPENNTESSNSDINTENNTSDSYSYTMDPKELRSKKGLSRLRKKKQSKSEMYEDFLYKPPVFEENSCGKIEKIPISCNYWVKQNSRLEVENYPQETIQKDLLERIQYITDYFDRFDNNNLTEEECQQKELTNFDGPYLPTPKHIEYFGNLNIKIDWEVPEEQQILFTYSNLKTCREKGLPVVRHPFIKSEDKIMLDNWKKFQEQYKFHDIRPLLGIRTMRVHCEGGQYIFETVEYLDANERYKFLLYIARGLEKRTRDRVCRRMTQIAMKMQDNEIIYRNKQFEPKEVAEIEAFIKLFGANWKGMAFFLGRVNTEQYRIFSEQHIKYKNVPMRVGPWQSSEISRLVRATFKTTNASSIQELINSKVKWKEVFPLFQTRNHHACSSYFKYQIKRKLEVASYLVKNEADIEKINWSSNDLIKLLKLVSENLGPTHNETDWDKISSHFEVFGPNCCSYTFHQIYNKIVPRNKKTSFRAAVDYVISDLVPQLEKGWLIFRHDYKFEDLHNLPLKKDENTKSFNNWSLKNIIKLIKVVYEIAGSTVETTSWSEVSSHFKNKDEKSCKNHFRFLFYNRVPHKHRTSLDSALEYLKKIVYPMLKQKKHRNVQESLLMDEVVNLSAEDRSILQAIQNDVSQADDDEDIAMLQENNKQN